MYENQFQNSIWYFYCNCSCSNDVDVCGLWKPIESRMSSNLIPRKMMNHLLWIHTAPEYYFTLHRIFAETLSSSGSCYSIKYWCY